MLRPPRPTLFPYTTLFRSHRHRRLLNHLCYHHVVLCHDASEHQVVLLLDLTVDTCTGRIDRQGKDRKSTRLNSSHTVISYAVFCLKKKNHPSILKATQVTS